MGIQLRTERRFEGSSSVGRYWLAQCEGFRVKGPGQMRGTVERVVGSVDPQRPEALVVRSLWRSRSIGVGEVSAVVPASRLLVVDVPAQRAAVVSTAAGKAGSAARVAGPVARDAASLALVAIAAVGRIVQYLAVQCGRFVVGTSAAVRADLRARKQLAIERQRRRSATRSTH